jgi:non-heme chloroperoxidase
MHRSDPEQIDQANATGRTPVVFIHDLWLLPSSWDRWAARFDEPHQRAAAPPSSQARS